MDKARLAQRLLEAFRGELEEHLRALNSGLVELERAGEEARREELFQELLRTAHNMKGAARAVGNAAIESLAHGLEDQLTEARGQPREEWRTELFPSLFALMDRLAAAGPPDAAETETAPRSAVEGKFVRLAAEQADVLLARSGELAVARSRIDGHEEQLDSLRQFVGKWRRDWTLAKPLLRAAERTPAARIVGAQQEQLARLSARLDRFAADLAADRKLLRTAAVPLEQGVQQARLLPLAEACAGLDRTVRDVAAQEGKQARLELSGTDVALDRAILEALRDPLVHLVRNAVSHGIEAPEVRRAHGKPEEGRVRLSGAVVGDRVEITVADDGSGLDVAAIRAAARRANLPVPASDEEAARLILHGLSSAPQVTEVSGRGVGLDIVRRRVEATHGQLTLSWREGQGTSFLLRVPLTLTTMRVLLVVAGGQQLAFPVTSVIRILRVLPSDLRTIEGRTAVLTGGVLVPVASLAQTLGLPVHEPSPHSPLSLVLVSHVRAQVAFAVDELSGHHEAVVKSLGARLRGLPWATGALMLPTGRLAVILRPSQLVAEASGERPMVLPRPAPAPIRRKIRVILADDSVTTRALERSILEAAGYEVLPASDGDEAWRLLHEQGAELLVSDVQMPRRDGVALTEAVRASPRFRHLPVVLVTSMSSEEDRARGLEAGANAYVVKSAFDQEGLLETLRQLVPEPPP